MEIFGPTLAGEGSVIGMQTMFIRFGGCDYRCQKCDSLHAVLPKLVKAGATYMNEEEIFVELTSKAGHCRTVTLSGGNPCMWDISNLVIMLKNHDWTILLETQGTLWQNWISFCDYITISPKGPGMGEKFEPNKFNEFIGLCQTFPWNHITVSVKVVIFDQRDIEFAKHIQNMLPIYPKIPLYLSLGNPWPPEPAHQDQSEGVVDLRMSLLERMASLYEDIKQEEILKEAIFLPQMHVLLWGNERGK